MDKRYIAHSDDLDFEEAEKNKMNTRKQFHCPKYKGKVNYKLICGICPEHSSCMGLALKLACERLNKTKEKERER